MWDQNVPQMPRGERRTKHILTSAEAGEQAGEPSNENIFRVTGHLCGECTGHRWIPRRKASDAELWLFFYLRLNKRLSKQSRSWWFQTQSRPLWRHSDDVICYHLLIWFVLAFWGFQNDSGTITACGQIFTISALRTAVLMLWAVVSSLIET